MRKTNHKFGMEDYKKGPELSERYNSRYAAEVMGVHPRTIRKWRAIIRKQRMEEDFSVEDYSTGKEPINDLIENRIKKFAL